MLNKDPVKIIFHDKTNGVVEKNVSYFFEIRSLFGIIFLHLEDFETNP